jgi:hypothetical protein
MYLRRKIVVMHVAAIQMAEPINEGAHRAAWNQGLGKAVAPKVWRIDNGQGCLPCIRSSNGRGIAFLEYRWAETR